MNHLGLIIGVEVFAVVSILLIVLLSISWRRKKRLTTEIEQLLNEVEKTRAGRKQWLEEILATKHQIAATETPELSQHFINAEKVFLQYIVKQQLEQSSLVNIYAQTRELLDHYLQLIPPPPPPQIIQNPVIIEPVAPIPNVEPAQAITEPEDEFLEVAETKPAIETEEPDWGDAFAESGDLPPSIEAADATLDAPETKLTIETEEPDWGDAFAESGDVLPDSEAVEASEPKAPPVTAENSDEDDWDMAFAEADQTPI